MNSLPEIAIVIPTLREVDCLSTLLPRVLQALPADGPRCEFIVVDDDSQDGTEELVSAYARQDKRVTMLVRKGKRGLSGAILHGWQHTDAGILGVMDADLQHPADLLPALIEAISQGYDLVVGSRYVSGGGLGRWNPLRKLISAAAVLPTLPIQRRSLHVSDPMSGFFLVRRRCIENLHFQPIGFKLLLEILVRGDLGSVAEVPFIFGERAAGKSKANVRIAWEYVQLLTRLYGLRFGGVPIIEEAVGD